MTCPCSATIEYHKEKHNVSRETPCVMTELLWYDLNNIPVGWMALAAAAATAAAAAATASVSEVRKQGHLTTGCLTIHTQLN